MWSRKGYNIFNKNGWNVLAIDREDIESRIKTKLSKEESKQFKFSRQKFEKIELEKNNLVIANFSLPFCNKIILKNYGIR